MSEFDEKTYLEEGQTGSASPLGTRQDQSAKNGVIKGRQIAKYIVIVLGIPKSPIFQMC